MIVERQENQKCRSYLITAELFGILQWLIFVIFNIGTTHKMLLMQNKK